MAITENIEFVRGEDVTIEVTVTGVNIAGWALSFAIARSRRDTAIITKTVGSGITITDEDNGVFEITIPDTDTDGIPVGPCVWDVKRSDAGHEAVLTRGKLELLPNVAE